MTYKFNIGDIVFCKLDIDEMGWGISIHPHKITNINWQDYTVIDDSPITTFNCNFKRKEVNVSEDEIYSYEEHKQACKDLLNKAFDYMDKKYNKGGK